MRFRQENKESATNVQRVRLVEIALGVPSGNKALISVNVKDLEHAKKKWLEAINALVEKLMRLLESLFVSIRKKQRSTADHHLQFTDER